METASVNYFIQSNGETLGPLSGEQIRLRLVEQGLKTSDLVRCENSEEWAPLGSFADFRDAALPPPSVKNPLAIISAVLGVAAICLLLPAGALRLPFPLLASIPAIICGHLAIRKIGHSYSHVRGYGAARTGLWCGYLTTFVIPYFFGIIVPKLSEKGTMSVAINNCRQVILVLHMYAADNSGNYPAAEEPAVRNSNEAFHRIFTYNGREYGIDEQIFGSPFSPFQPDGKIGDAPLYLKALTPGENHWAMTNGLIDSDPGFYPLVYENPVEASWPPKWNANVQKKPQPGRSWSGGKVIIGMNDCSVSAYNLESTKGDPVGLKKLPNGKDVFPENEKALNEKALSVLNVAR